LTIATRRTFLRCTGALSSYPFLRGLSAYATPPPTAYVRKDIASLSATDSVIVSYRRAIRAMMALPTTNPLSWAYQAAIHGTTLPGPPQPAWNTCTHGSYYFWPWHRMYLYWFERIIRKMSGDPTWALPYWNWSSSAERQLPAVFRDTASELYTSHRNNAMNSGAGSLPPSDVSYATAFSFTDFTSGSGSLEGTPHGAVHVDVGGWMSSVPTAAQDPVFYLHHCNIDRLWNLWLTQGGRTDPLGDGVWKNQALTFFDENGGPVTMKACDVLRASEQLQYTYDNEPPQVKEYCLRIIRVPVWAWTILFRFPIPPVELTGEPVERLVDISPIREKLAVVGRAERRQLALKLDNVEAEKQPGASWEVYLTPAKATGLTLESPFFLGLVALFGAGVRTDSHMEFQPASFTFPIQHRLIEVWTKEPKMTLTFVPHGILIDGKPSRPKVLAPARIGSVSLIVGAEGGKTA